MKDSMPLDCFNNGSAMTRNQIVKIAKLLRYELVECDCKVRSFDKE